MLKISEQAHIHKVVDKEWSRTTHLGVGAHQDDIEIMACHGILECMGSEDQWFSEVIVTDGAGSVRSGEFKDYSDEQMKDLRRQEQITAAERAQALGVIQLGYKSQDIKKKQSKLSDDLANLIEETQPKVIYTHNPADKHLTHVAVVMHLLKALRKINYQPEFFLGCEVWRALDWLPDEKKVALPINCADQLILELIGCHRSQTAAGKGFDQATVGRMRSNAAYLDSHHENLTDKVWYAMDLKPLLDNPKLSVEAFVFDFVGDLKKQIKNNLEILS